MEGTANVRLHLREEGRPIGLRWSVGSRSGEVSSGEYVLKRAERAAGRLEEQLEAGVIPGRSEGITITWADFRERYETEWLAEMSRGSRQGWRTAGNHFERLCKPKLLMDVDKSMLSRFRAKLEETGIKSTSVKSYYLALHAGLGWAADVADLIERAPSIRQRKVAKRSAAMQSRPVTTEEFERMLLVVPRVRRSDAPAFDFFLKGLWLSSLRLDELNRLRWETDKPLHVDLSKKTPMIVFLGAQKNGEDTCLPAPPEFWELIDRPGVPRRGYVFPMEGRWQKQISTLNIGRRISEIGRKAGVLVNADGKHTPRPTIYAAAT